MKTSFLKYFVISSILLCSFLGFSQEYKSFSRTYPNGEKYRYQTNIRGNITFIANNIVNRDGGTSSTEPNDSYNNLSDSYTSNYYNRETGAYYNYNDSKNMRYIDVDNDNSTFSSSTATFSFTNADCNLIRYAALYWSATYPRDDTRGASGTPRQYPIDQIKFKVPGGTYVDITGEILHDGLINVAGKPSLKANAPYAVYADVTHLLTALPNPEGAYTIANVPSAQGKGGMIGGAAGGWTLVIVYENPNESSKLISTFDGFARVSNSNSVNIKYDGFETVPTGRVDATIGVAALEGDYNLGGDGISIRALDTDPFLPIGKPRDNVFNSDISIDGTITTNRIPNSLNTLGFDADMFIMRNGGNTKLPNSATEATFQFNTNRDQYYPFFNSFNVEIIEPNIVLEKKVTDNAGVPIDGQGVHFSDYLKYVLTFENIGNDDAKEYTIRDVLPINVTLIEADLELPDGVTYVYDAPNRTITFTIPNNLVAEDYPPSSIKMRVQVAEDCFDFVDACTNEIKNIAYSTYKGVTNDYQRTDDPSVSDFDDCGFVTAGATNFLLDDLENCNFSRTVLLCGDNVLLNAGDNFDSYRWYKDENGNGVIDTGIDTEIFDANTDGDFSTMLVDEIGTYIVDKIIVAPCKGFTEIITVERFGATQTNPITALINDPTNTVEGEIVICGNDGSELPKVFLCGLNDTELIQINIPDADSIEWRKLNETSCGASSVDCANKNAGCTWDVVGAGSDYIASEPGQYRLIINYQNGCSSPFYFNIFKNPLDPQLNKTDLICTSPGNITITNMPAGYDYQLVNAVNNAIVVPYSANNGPSFDLTSNGSYTVEMKQQGVVGGCIFRVEDISIEERDFQVGITTKDTDCNGLGEISISVLNVEAQYYYKITQGASTVGVAGPSNDKFHLFQGLNDGVYDVEVTTDNGCVYTEQVTIADATDLDLEARTLQHISCDEGQIEMIPSGGKEPYSYAIWSFVDPLGVGGDLYASVNDIPGSAYESDKIFDILNPGDYTFIIVDGNNCTSFSNIENITLVPSVDYTTNITNETCFGLNDGSYIVTMNASNGYNVTYTLKYPDTAPSPGDPAPTPGATIETNNSGVFTGLSQGDYEVVLTQTKGSASCSFKETFTISGPVDGPSGNIALVQDYTCGQDASIKVENVSGGSAPYEYSLDGIIFNNGPGSEVFANLTEGTYTITIRDDNGCTFETTSSITIDPLNEPSDLTFSATAPNCPTQTSDVTVTVVDGNTPFIFEIIAPSAIAATTTTGNSANFSGLAPNTYTFKVTDNKGCAFTKDFTIAPVDPINVVGQLVDNITCFTDTDGKALFTVSGFSTNYSYAVTGPQTFNGASETNTTIPLNSLDDGIYTIVVTDAVTNCTATASVTIEAPTAALDMTVTQTQPTCTSTGSVVLVASNGWGSYEYTLTNPDGSLFGTNSTGSFTNLVQYNTYTALVKDANGCEITKTFVLNEAIAPSLEIIPNDLCYDSAIGLELTANVTAGGDGNYQYSLNGGIFDTANVFSNLTSGTHTINVRDGNNCTGSATITINPELSVTANAVAISACTNTTDVTITAAGGDGVYQYAIVDAGTTAVVGDFNTSNTITVTGAGDYDVYVWDNNGNATTHCDAMYTITIAKDAILSVSATNTSVLCSGSNQASITVLPVGGSGSYTYSIDNGVTYQTVASFSNIAAGNYTIKIVDSKNCSATIPYSIVGPEPLTASAGIASDGTCSADGSSEVRFTNVNGGTVPYEYSFNGTSFSSAPGADIENLMPGDYILSVRDAGGCRVDIPITVENASPLPAMTSNITYNCDGSGNVIMANDQPTYSFTYKIDGVSNTPVNNNTFNNLAPGNYIITSSFVPTTPPTPSKLLHEDFGSGPTIPSVETSGYHYENQLDDITPSGAPIDPNRKINDYEYSVTSSIVSPFGSWLNPVDHTSGSATGRYLVINIGEPIPGLIIYKKVINDIIPNQSLRISISAINLLRSSTGGLNPDLVIQLRIPGTTTVIGTVRTNDIPKDDVWHDYEFFVNPGTNTSLDFVIITEKVGTGGNDVAIDDILIEQIPSICERSIDTPIVIEAGKAFEANILSFTNVSCNGLADGTITFEVENFDPTTGFEYSTDGTNFTTSLTSPVTTTALFNAGSHSIIVRRVNEISCTRTITETIAQPNALVVGGSITDDFTCNNTGATITATATDGSPTYEFQLENNLGTVVYVYQDSPIFANIPANASGETYIVRVKDANNCEETSSSISVVTPDNPTFIATPTACYSGNNDGTILVTASGGSGSYQFKINGGPWLTPTPSTANTYTFSSLTNGNYDIDVKDSFGCTALQQNIPINQQLTASAIVNPDLTCLAPASVTISANGGSGTYTYEWSNDGGTNYFATNFTANVFSTSTAGTYQFRVTDTTGTPCIYITNPVPVTPAPKPVITAVTPTNVLCSGNTTGALDVVINTAIGTPVFVINVLETNTTTNYGTQTTGLPAGDYAVTITDDKGCISDPFLVSITEPNAITYDINLVPITCSTTTGTNPGSITVENLAGGTAEYTYFLTGNNGFSSNYVTTAGGEDHTFPILEFGIYEVDVVDANGCSLRTINIIASPPDDLNIDVSAMTTNCAVGGTAVVTVATAILGTDYEFAILDTFTSPYSSTYFAPDVPSGPTRTFTGLTPGITYTFVVHDKTTNCYYFETSSAPITSPSSMTAAIDAVANITCKGADDGNVSFTIDNFDATATSVTYEIFRSQSNLTTSITGSSIVNSPAGPVSISNFATLDPGIYYILFKEVGGTFSGCSISSADFTITESSVSLSLTAASPKNDNCNVNAGIITALAQNGTAPYTYQYLLSTATAPTTTSAGWVTTTTVNVESGDYTVYVKDDFGCVFSDNITVNLDTSPLISLAIADECTIEGSFDVVVTLDQAGISPYLLSVNGSAFQSIVFNGSSEYTISGLNSGVQIIEIKDLNGCGETENITIHPPLQFNATLTTLLDCEAVPANNAELTIDVTSGSGTYEYEIIRSGTIIQTRGALPSNPFVWNLATLTGDYTVNIYDMGTASECSEQKIVNVPIAVTPNFTFNATNVTCNSGSDGTIALTQIDNGINPLTYAISPVAGTFNSTTSTFENLAAGTYTITATGTNSCTTTSVSIPITQPNAIVIAPVAIVEFGCANGNNTDNATITVTTVNGGSNNFVRYEFINNDDPNTAAVGDPIVVQDSPSNTYTETNTSGGNYTINVYDDNDCSEPVNATIQSFDKLVNATAAVTTEITCDPGNDAVITITATTTNSDATKLEYSKDNGTTWQDSNIFTSLGINTYSFLIRHKDTGCVINTSETVIDSKNLDLEFTKLSDVICYNGNEGRVQYNLKDASNVTYSDTIVWVLWNTNGTPLDFSDDTSVTGTDPDGNFIIPSSTPGLVAGVYFVEVTLSNNPKCTYTHAFTILGPEAAITGNTVETPITCVPGSDGIIDIINVDGGWGDYTYYVGTTAPTMPIVPSEYVASPKFENLSAGTYQAWVKDKNGCVQMVKNGINLSDPIAITAVLRINQENCTNLQGEIEVTPVSNGQGSNYSYQLVKGGSPIGAIQTTAIFSNLGAGTYSVIVSDQWGCSSPTNDITLYEELNLSITTNNPIINCASPQGGRITVSVIGGSTNLEFIATYPDGSVQPANSTGVFSSLSQAGTYSVTVRDLDTNNPVCEKTITKVLDAPTAVTLLDYTPVHVSCFGLADGQVTINLVPTSSGVNDNPIYNYTLYDAAGTTIVQVLQTSPIFNNLAANIYQVKVESPRDCEVWQTIIITEPTQLLIDAVATDFSCNPSNGINTSVITVSILDGATTPGTVSGTSPYLYSIDGVAYQTSNTFEIIDNGTQQTIIVSVKDAKSCPATETVVIEPLNKFTVAVTQIAAITCANPEEVLVTISDNGDVTNTYTYTLLPLGNPNGTQTATPMYNTAEFDLTEVGNYTIRVTDTKTGCFVDTNQYTINPYDLIEVTATATSQVTCFGTPTGKIDILISGYSGGYSYEVFNAITGVSTGITANVNTSTNPQSIDVPGGSFFVRVLETDALSTLCSDDSNTVKVVSPDIVLSATANKVADVTCTNDLGEIYVNPIGGYSPYTIQITNNSTGVVNSVTNVLSHTFTGLSAANYSVVITDAGGCAYNASETLDPATIIQANISQSLTDLVCEGDTNASVTAISISGGQGVGNYQYQLNHIEAGVITYTTGGQFDPTFNNLGAGTYSITVSDGWNCGIPTPQVTISEPAKVSSSLALANRLTCDTDASLTLTATGGSAPYSYSTTGTAGSFVAMSGGNTHMFTNITANTTPYQYYVVDQYGCKAMISNQILIQEIAPIVIDIDKTDAYVNCNGEATASITADASGGLGNYSYELFTDAAFTNRVQGPVTNVSQAVFRNLTAGSYYIQVTSDGNCAQSTVEIEVLEPTPLVVDYAFTNISCNGADDGSITMSLSGGSGTYTYAISPNLNKFDTISSFTDLTPGDYVVIAQDVKGCFEKLDFTITEPDSVVIAPTEVLPEICAGSEDGSIQINISGGTAPYRTSINSNSDADFIADQTSFTGLASGTHVIFVKDANDCDSNLIIEIDPGVNINATVVPVYECSENSPTASVGITFEDATVLPDVMYALDSNDPANMVIEPNFGDISPGDHSITIFHANGCLKTYDFTVASFEPLALVLEQNNINEITAIASGGREDYIITLDGEITTNGKFNIYRTDTYTVTVTDENGCAVSKNIFMEFIDIKIPNFFTPDGDGKNDTWIPKNLESFPEIMTIIFDRYGREVYRMGINDSGWDGLYQNTNLPTGDYWYVIKLQGDKDDREFTGHFTLYR